MKSFTNLVLPLMLFFLRHVRTHKILLHPLPFTSHCIEMVAIGDELIKRNHEVTLFVPDWFDYKKCTGDTKVKTIRFPVNPTSQEYVKFQKIAKTLKQEVFTGEFSIFTSIGLGEELVSTYCHSFLQHSDLLSSMRKDNFDLAIEDGRTVSQCLYLLPVTLGIPYASISSLIHHDLSAGVFPGTFYPHIASPFSTNMTTFERVINMFTYLFAPVVVWIFSPTFDKYRYGDKYRNVDLTNIMKKSELFIENADYVMDYPKALFPNVVQVGGLTITPPKPLPPELKAYFDGATSGVIVASLGSLLPDLPYYVVEQLVDALSKVNMAVIFKLENGKPYKNIKYVKWFPQNDALAHSNTKLFVSHCGINGFYESLYNGVPLICFPLHSDHFQMAIKVVDNRVGRSFDIHKATSEEILGGINDVLQNNMYKKNMLRNLEMIKDRAETPRQRAVRAVEHVIKYGGKHMAPLSRDLNVLQMANAELWLIAYFAMTILIIGCYKICKRCCLKRILFSKVVTFIRKCFQQAFLMVFTFCSFLCLKFRKKVTNIRKSSSLKNGIKSW